MQTRILMLAFLALSALSGCNSTDALTPQVDVGGGTFRSPPVNQSDLDRMEQQTAYAPPQASGQVTSGPAFAAQGLDTSTTVMAQGDTDYSDPAGSLDAQAGLLARGDIPAQERTQSSRLPPIDQEPARIQQQGREHSDTAVLDNTPGNYRQQAADDAAADTEAAQPMPQKQQSAAVAPGGDAGSIRFLPIIGAPVAAVTPLSKQLGAQARARGLTIRSASDTASRHILKGYFSTLKDGGKTTVIYVWDVLDSGGNRLHRIQGQETVDATAPDLWAAVPASTMQTIATRTIDTYLAWSADNPG